MRLKYIIVLIAILLLIPITVGAKNLYVNNSGSPACDDTTTRLNNDINNPWCNLLRAVRGQSDNDRNSADDATNAAQAGDTVYVTAGTYDYDGANWTGAGWKNTLYDPVNTGSAGNWIVFQANGVVELTSSATISAGAVGVITGYVEWNGFTIEETATWHREPFVSVEVDHAKITNMILTSVWEAVDGQNHPGIMIHGSRSVDCDEGIGDIEITNNTISGFRGGGDTNSGNGITVYCAGYDLSVLIENNTIDNGTGVGIYAKEAPLDPIIDPSVTIRFNEISNYNQGIRIQAWMNWHVTQNIIRDNTALGIALHANESDAGGSTKPNSLVIQNNTMENNVWGFYFKGLCADYIGNIVQNNILSNYTHAFYSEDADCEAVANMGADDIAFNFNRYEISGNFWNSAEATLSGFETNYSQGGSSSTNDDPASDYANIAGDDYRLCTASGVPDVSCSGASNMIVGGASDCEETTLDLSGAGNGNPSTCGAYITGDETIGVIVGSGSSVTLIGIVLTGGAI